MKVELENSLDIVSAMKRQFIITALKKCYDVVIGGTLKPHGDDFVKRCVRLIIVL